MMQQVEMIAAALYSHFFEGEWPPSSPPDLGMGADDWRAAARLVTREIERLTAENERLRQYLGRAIDIANGSGGDFDWSAEEELRNMRSYQQKASDAAQKA